MISWGQLEVLDIQYRIRHDICLLKELHLGWQFLEKTRHFQGFWPQLRLWERARCLVSFISLPALAFLQLGLTGYIQQWLIRALEDVMVCYDSTVWNSLGDLVQWIYGLFKLALTIVHLNCRWSMLILWRTSDFFPHRLLEAFQSWTCLQ